jgi:hypothetical protein
MADDSTDFDEDEAEEQAEQPARGFRPSFAHVLGAVLFVAIVLMTAREVSRPGSHLGDESATNLSHAAPEPVANRPGQYAWLSAKQRKSYEPLVERIPPPAGFARVEAPPGSFADWLRCLPLMPPETPVTAAKGEVILRADHASLAAVVALQPQTTKTLSASNMLVRLRAEYLWAIGKADDAAFHFTSGHLSTWQSWAQGERPTVHGRDVAISKGAPADASRTNYCGYLESIFRYGTVYSLLLDTDKSAEATPEGGDVFVRPGRPGHAVMILDVAVGPQGQVRVLLGEGGTPAQTFHVLRYSQSDPWFPLSYSQPINLGLKNIFHLKDLRRWKDSDHAS